jgi:hypothetical protein
VREYDAEKGPAIYRDRQWTKPSGPPFNMTFAEADALPLAIAIEPDQVFTKGEIVAKPRQPQLMRADLLVYYMMRDSWPTRPIYFSRTAGGYPYDLGLERYVITQGLAKKLAEKPITPGRDTIVIPGEGFVDVKRTHALWSDVFTARKSLSERNGWVDDASVGIPDLYVITGVMLAEALAQTGDLTASSQVFEQSRGIAKAMRREQLFGFDRIAPQTGGDSRPGTPLNWPPAAPPAAPPAPPRSDSQ